MKTNKFIAHNIRLTPEEFKRYIKDIQAMKSKELGRKITHAQLFMNAMEYTYYGKEK